MITKEQLKQFQAEFADKAFTASDIATITSMDGQKRCWSPEFAMLFESRDVAAVIEQLAFWWVTKGQSPFYKYIAPCSASAQGDSWCEELTMSEYQFTNIMKLIGQRVSGKKEAEEVIKGKDMNCLVAWYTGKDHVTWYFVNYQLILELKLFARAKFEKFLPAPKKDKMEKSDEVSVEDKEDRPQPKTFSLPTLNSLVTDLKNSGSYYRTTQNYTEQDFCRNDEKSKIEEKEEKVFEVTRKSDREKVKAKANRTYSDKQKAMMRAKKMPLDYSVSSVTMEKLENEGYDPQGLETIARRHFIHYTTGTGKNQKSSNWDASFEQWVLKDYSMGYILKNGVFYKKNPSQERLEYFQEQAQKAPMTVEEYQNYNFEEEVKRVYYMQLNGELD